MTRTDRTAARVASALLWAGVALALTGCGGQVLSAGGVTVLVAARTDAGMDALGGGRVEVLGGCLGAGGAVVVWPHGTDVVSENPLTIEIPDLGRFALGDEVEVPGGYVVEHGEGADVEPGPHEVGGVTVPARCAEHDVFLARR